MTWCRARSRNARLPASIKVVSGAFQARSFVASAEENAHSALDQGDYQQKYKTYVERYEVVKDRLTEINEQRFEHITKREHITRFLKLLKQSSELLTEFDEELWYSTVDTVTVHLEHKLTFKFKDGTELPWKI